MNIKAPTYDFLERPANLSRGSITTYVADALRRAIVTLQLPPGTLIEKSEICERLGVSRFPIAEAFARLNMEGLVEILPQRGTLVSRLRIADVREFMFIRTALEVETVHELASHASEPLIAELRDCIARQERAVADGDQDAYLVFDIEFHERLFSTLRFGRAQGIIDNARLNIDRARRLLNTPRRATRSIGEHRIVVDALERRDAEAAATAMRTHIGGIMADVFRVAREQPELFADGESRLATSIPAEPVD
jgi:DNA-binding GntR family transcriptional regulator